MCRINGELLYIGKATSLKQRINSYFRPKTAHAEHILEMLTQAGKIEITPTLSALEAAELEVEHIQRWRPPYNRALRDDDRRIIFFSRDFRKLSTRSDTRHDLGPFPDNSASRTLPAFSAWLAQVSKSKSTECQSARWLTMMMPELPPDLACGKAGLDLFLERYRPWLTDRPILKALNLLGARFWQEKKQASNAGKQPSSDEPLDDLDATASAGQADIAAAERQWTPDLISVALQSRLRHWAHLLRRSRWLCILSQSSLAWLPQDQRKGNKHVILLKYGAITDRMTLPLAAPLPVPPGFAVSAALRRQSMDMATYDRLRVLTTELRRLVAQGRFLELRTGPRTRLSNLSLTRLMYWI